MARPVRRAYPPVIFGFLVLDKPAGPTSHDCVSRVRRAYGLKRVGHGGTLDPAVTGVLPIALGPATRLLPYLPGEKAYLATVQLGVRTSTDDLEGAVLQQWPLPSHLLTHDIESALTPFRGSIAQRPPAFSAVHVQGQRAYSLARAGQDVELPPRLVHLHRLDLLAWDPSQGRVHLAIDCSSGTYVRSLARDLGEALGCGGALASLRRTSAMGFQLSQSVPLDALMASPPPPLLDPMEVLVHLPRHHLAPGDWEGWCCGRAQEAHQPLALGDPVLVVAPDGKVAGLAKMADGVLQPRVVFAGNG